MTLRLSWPEFVQVLAQGRGEAERRYQRAVAKGDSEAAATWASELRDWDKLLAVCNAAHADQAIPSGPAANPADRSAA